jgi:hypothetical protein
MQFLEEVRQQRRDLGDLLFHFTRTPREQVVMDGGRIMMSAHAGAVLEKIAREGRLIGSNGYIRGGYRCVCFSETPISEIPTVLRLAQHAAEEGLRPRYEPYGVAIPKEWLFAQGGRPVIYQPDDEFDLLPEEMKYRHVRYEPGRVDFTWEREWRIRTDELKIDPEHTLFVLPTADAVFEFTYGHASLEGDDYDDETGLPGGFYHEPRWMAVSLDLFGLKPSGEA